MSFIPWNESWPRNQHHNHPSWPIHHYHPTWPSVDRVAHYNRLRREMDELLTPAIDMLQNISQPRLIIPNWQEDPNKFEVKLDVTRFAPEEITVKMTNNFAVIEGKHEEKQDEHGFISRQFIRRYSLPDDVKQEEVICDLSSDGVLMLTAPRHAGKVECTERRLPINFTGRPAITATPAKEHKPIDEGHKTSAAPIAVP